MTDLRPGVLWNQADTLREKARRLRQDADALDRAADRLSAMAAAIQDGREADLLEVALSIGRER